MKIALIGYGNMGKDVELLALKQGHQIIARVDPLGGDNVSPTITEELLSEASELFDNLITPIEDMRGTPEHRVDLAKTLFKRTIRDAVSRANGERI